MDLSNPKRRKELKRKNLRRFRLRARHIYDLLQSHTPASSLVFDDDGQPDAAFPGGQLYGGAMNGFVEQQLEGFWRQPTRLVSPLNDIVSCEYVGPALERLLQRSKDAGLDFEDRPPRRDSYFLSIFGIGLCGHIDELVEQTQCRSLFIVDASPEFLSLSLEIYDWSKLYRTLTQRNGTLWFLIGDEPDYIARELRSWLRNTSPMAVDGATFFHHYQNDVLDTAQAIFDQRFPYMLNDMGRLFDESVMVRNTHYNLFLGDARVYRRDDRTIEGVPAFVIAAGPSFDKDAEFVRDNQENAVVVSCGTALRSLLTNGITPDFHVEQENIRVAPTLAAVSKEFDITPITLVTTTTVEPKVVPLFDQALFYFREGPTPRNIFCDSDERVMPDATITVANAGLAFVQETGFREIYLFGCDMGVKEGEERHHAKDTYHYTPDAFVPWHSIVHNISMPPNFDGRCHSHVFQFLCLVDLERSIKRDTLTRAYFNCSDGCRIQGTTPKRSGEVELPALADGIKATAIESVFERFPPYPRRDFDAHWDDQQINEMCDTYLNTIEAAVTAFADYDDRSYMIELMMHLGQPHSGPRKPVINLFSGSLFQMLIAFEFFLRRLDDQDDIRKFEALFKNEFRRLIAELRGAADDAVGNLTARAESGDRDALASLAPPPNSVLYLYGDLDV